MKKGYLMCAAGLTLSGCSSIALFDSAEDPLVTQLTGQPVEFVQQKLGLPHQRKDLPTGAMVWTYIDNDKGIMGTQCSVIVSIRKNQVERVSVITNTTSAVSMLGKPCATLRAKIG